MECSNGGFSSSILSRWLDCNGIGATNSKSTGLSSWVIPSKTCTVADHLIDDDVELSIGSHSVAILGKARLHIDCVGHLCLIGDQVQILIGVNMDSVYI